MLTCRIVGMKQVNFETREGQHMEGVKIFITCEDDKVDGLMTDSFFLTRDKFPDADKLVVGSDVIVYFNRYGKVDSLAAA